MRTIGRHYYGPRRNWIDTCSFCGVEWPRHKLVLDPDGYLRCPDDLEGRGPIELDTGNAMAASDMPVVRGKTRYY